MQAHADVNFVQKMQAAGSLVAGILEKIAEYVRPGVTTDKLNELCHEYIVSAGAVPAPLGYHGFPKSICTSINHVVCHGIPNDKPLKNGDIINIDVSLSKDGVYADSCKMYFVGECSVMAKRIVKCAKECLYVGIAKTGPGVNLRVIGAAIAKHAASYGYSVVRDFCGHGIGTALHTAPQVLHYDTPGAENFILQPGMTFTIEPMINVGKADVRVLADGWTAVTKDKSLSAQYEHTLLVTDTGFKILTLRQEENLADIEYFAQHAS